MGVTRSSVFRKTSLNLTIKFRIYLKILKVRVTGQSSLAMERALYIQPSSKEIIEPNLLLVESLLKFTADR
jgi:hypothetical protein